MHFVWGSAALQRARALGDCARISDAKVEPKSIRVNRAISVLAMES
jgi:hypothetical protein